jgi:serine-type D-Ala-D-Ala carboxypeptidase/endopeptidase (penicillin-binding protein 4)
MLTSAVGLLAGAIVVGLLLKLDGGGSALPDEPTAMPGSAALPGPMDRPDLLAPLTGAQGSAPSRAGLAGALGPLMLGLGGSVGVSVVDGARGTLLYAADADIPRTPASTTKLLTASAALSVLGPQKTLSTKVVAGPESDAIILVGGGDPTLTTADEGTTVYPTPASLSALAARTAAALKGRGTRSVRLGYDDSLFTGPDLPQGWTTRYFAGTQAVVARVSALAVDGGRLAPSDSTRSTQPAQRAADRFAELLQARGIDVQGVPERTDARHSAKELAAVASPPVSSLVERMLTNSDNDIAEALARQVAIARGKQASFAGGAQAVAQAIGKLGIDLRGLILNDGSGLSHANAIPPKVLTDVLLAAGKRPELRAVLSGLPVAGFSGTLWDRAAVSDTNGGAPDLDSAGVVRAKTGSLNGVSALAGVVADKDGRLLVFAVLADHVLSRDQAERALDHIAAELASCGCQ